MKTKTRYKHLVEKPSLCGPACLSMILLRKEIWIDQEIIAEEIGARIMPKEYKLFSVKLKFPKNPKDAGINLIEFDKKRVKDFFKKHKLAITSEVFYISKIKDVKKFIKENLDKNYDIMANIHMVYFDKSKQWGHFVLIESINVNTVTFCDPDPQNKSYSTTNIPDLIKSMDKKIDGKERGFVIFKNQTIV